MAIPFTPLTFSNNMPSGYALDENFQEAKDAFVSALSREHSTDNEMRVDLDMNSRSILNVDLIQAEDFQFNSINNQSLQELVDEAYNWAQYPVDDLVPEGNGTTEYSAFHHRTKADDAQTAAETAQTAAELAETAAAATLVEFESIYWGSFASEPSVNVNGESATSGDLYYNTTDDKMYVYSGTVWQYILETNANSVVYTPSGDLVATDVQAALDELDDEKVPRTSETGAAELPTGTTAERPAGEAGYFRFNEDISAFEGHNGNDWAAVGDASEISAGSITKMNGDALSPIFPNNVSYITDGRWHRGLTYRIVPLADRWVAIWNEARNHGPDNLARVLSAQSFDHGVTWSDYVVAYDEAGTDASDFSVIEMGSGRIGLIALRRQEPSTVLLPVFIYSDDKGLTWSSSILTSATSGFASQFGMSKYPAAAGGHDTNGYIAYGYISGVRTSIVYQYTVDNGVTWTEGTAFTDATYTDVAEPSVARIGSENKWVMFVRDESAHPSNFLMSTSTNMTTWTAPVDSGQPLGRNAGYMHYSNGEFHAYAFSRQWRGREIGTDGKDDLLYQRVNADTLWSDVTSWTGWTNLLALHRPLGYMQTFESNGELFAVFATEEGGTGNTSDEGIRIGLRNTSRIMLMSRESRQDSWGNDQGGVVGSSITGAFDGPGSWRRTGDGIQECWIRDLELTYVAATSLSATWTFPKEFFNSPLGPQGVFLSLQATVTGTPEADWRAAILRVREDNSTHQQLEVNMLQDSPGTFTAGDSIKVSVHVVGKWKEG